MFKNTFFLLLFLKVALFVWCVLYAWAQKGFLGPSPTQIQSQTQGKSSPLTSGALSMGKQRNDSFIPWPPGLSSWWLLSHTHKLSVPTACIRKNSLKYTASNVHQPLGQINPKSLVSRLPNELIPIMLYIMFPMMLVSFWSAWSCRPSLKLMVGIFQQYLCLVLSQTDLKFLN